MEKSTRIAIERATQRARKLLEEDFAAQLEADFDIHRDGTMAAHAGSHLSPELVFKRERIVAAIEHKRAAGMSAGDSIADYRRDAAFTILNRFVALRMLEVRELVQECVRNGEQSSGYREFYGMAPGLPLLPNSEGYRLYIESVFDELSTEVKVLFDRADPSTVLWPKRNTFESLLVILNAAELADVWREDETIGWVYQFFNGQDERRQTRKESQAPRNSRELAIRNQFFTPRYVVQFLAENTLGRIWYEMHGSKTKLLELCEYMVRDAVQNFESRPKKDPRDLRVLDPACGSGHFLLYTFDLLLVIYEDAYADPKSPKSEATGRTLLEDYPDLQALREALPGLILRHNLYGVDIDPRCAQIAQLSLWMRAQKAYRDFGFVRAERPQIHRSNIIVAEPIVAEERLAKDFVARLNDAELEHVFTVMADALDLAGDLGLLLRVEALVRNPIERGQTLNLFVPPEERIRAALASFADEDREHINTRRRLFAEDANQGVGLLEIAEKRFDAILMNPPFGELSPDAKRSLLSQGSLKPLDAYAQFLYRASELLHAQGRIGALVSKTFLSHAEFEPTRRWLLSEAGGMHVMLDLGTGVLDAAVEVAALILSPGHLDQMAFFDMTDSVDRAGRLRQLIATSEPTQVFLRYSDYFLNRPGVPLTYWMDDKVSEELSRAGTLVGQVTGAWGLFTADDERFVRTWWEVPLGSLGLRWNPYAKGGSPQGFFAEPLLVVNWNEDGAEILSRRGDRGQVLARAPNKERFGDRGFTYSSISSSGFRVRPLNEGTIFSIKGPGLFPRVKPSEWMKLLELVNCAEVSYLLSTLSVNRSAELNYALRISVPNDWSSHFTGEIAKKLNSLYSWVASGSETSRYFSGHPMSRNIDEAFGASFVDDLLESLRAAGAAAYAQTGLASRDTEAFAFTRAHLPASPPCDAHAFASYLLGCAFGRWRLPEAESTPQVAWGADSFAPLPASPPASMKEASPKSSVSSILVNDNGHPHDLMSRVQDLLSLCPDLAKVIDAHGLLSDFGPSFFGEHIRRYSTPGRSAPIYWQIATPSANYSVWLYIHSFSRDTLFRVQNDYAAPKLAHEERRLDSLRNDLYEVSTAAQRKAIYAQELFVEELRNFLEEVKRIAPLWNPNLDDGVAINFALLWRLVPQSKPWQKELKATWDSLCHGEYDWAQLAMHLWPERVVPKCAVDRSFALAHGLEDNFWTQGRGGKWISRKTPKRSADELVRERHSPAVKAALRSLLEAPSATRVAKRNGRKRIKVAVEGENA